jgi:hypothetical protein
MASGQQRTTIPSRCRSGPMLDKRCLIHDDADRLSTVVHSTQISREKSPSSDRFRRHLATCESVNTTALRRTYRLRRKRAVSGLTLWSQRRAAQRTVCGSGLLCRSAQYTRITGLASLQELAPAALSRAVQSMLLMPKFSPPQKTKRASRNGGSRSSASLSTSGRTCDRRRHDHLAWRAYRIADGARTQCCSTARSTTSPFETVCSIRFGGMCTNGCSTSDAGAVCWRSPQPRRAARHCHGAMYGTEARA